MCSLVLEWVPLARLLEGFALLGFDSVQTLLRTSSGLSIGHSEDIIGRHSSVDPRVSWDWLTELWHFLALLDFVDAVEVINSFILALCWFVLSLVVHPLNMGTLRVGSSNLLVQSLVWGS